MEIWNNTTSSLGLFNSLAVRGRVIAIVVLNFEIEQWKQLFLEC